MEEGSSHQSRRGTPPSIQEDVPPACFPSKTFSQGELTYMHIPATEAPAAMAASASIA